MDFPSSLRPTLFMTGPLGLSDVPDTSFMCSWRDALSLPESLPQDAENRVPHLAKGLFWEPDTPGPLPLLPPGPDPWDPGLTAQDLLFRGGPKFRRQPRAVLDVTEQLSRFLWDHGDIAYAPLGKLMLENFKLEGARVSLGIPQPPTAPVLHPWGPDPRQVSGEPPGRAAARGAGDAVGAAAPGRCFYRRCTGLASRKDAPALLAVRSDYHCALWKVSKQGIPAPLQVLRVEKGATGISLSPHLPGELAVCSRSGAICLWTAQDGWPISSRLRQIYKDPETLVFRDPSPWRWADFTAHPRVLTVGDRTGVKMIDTQGPPGCGLLLFRGGAEAECQKGERVLLTQYLGECGPESLQPTLHLICTQFSLYLVDERLPLVPMLKWDHGLPSAPLLARLLPPLRPGCPRPLLLGGQGGQLQLLHITGEGTSTPRLAGLPQSLPSRSNSLSAFPLLEPRSQQRLQERLQAPTIGLATAISPSASTPVLSLFQLSAAGDVFHQRLHLREDTSDPGPDAHAPMASWSPQDTACCRRWLKALLEEPPAPPVWAVPTFSYRRLLGFKEQQKVEGKVPEGLRTAMAKGQLLQQRDLGSLPTAEPPPAAEPGPEDELSERLEAAWEGPAAAWWEQRRGRGSGPGKQPKRHKRRTQLSSTFSSLSGRLDFSDAPSPHHSPERTSPVSRPQPPVTPPSQELTQELWARGVPSERQQTLRDYMAKLPLQGDFPESASAPLSQTSSIQATSFKQQALRDCTAKLSLQRDTPGSATVPSSQTSSMRATPSRQLVPVLCGSQPHRKKPRMGF
ncbi:TATA box-binding protein-associated factor RNA polymerase I subunit C isoform X4 [Pteropus medius]|uniref:TATA box-binding protein-associated factor RNA polymerase I subunit C isoform X4 n=1 Tax=Pteropus vampyrus TaxID=132908 RepID=UPI00196B1EDC|nr:TATA box-binding protein-associated factor RNA polymerase I subunit C isoform X4 [Pteropus giganteus]